jgi:hypothetical protein
MTKEIYSFRVQGYLDQERSGWFDGLTITHTAYGETILSGPVVDQAALHGVLLKIRDLGLSLLEVKRDSLALDYGQANLVHESEQSSDP